MEVIDLKAGPSTLSLRIGENNWCKVYAYIGNRNTELGADDAIIIASRMLKSLSNSKYEKNVVGKINEVDVWCVASLSEKHSTIYAGTIDGLLRFFIQDANASLIGTIDLSEKDKNLWRETLEGIE